MGKMANYLLDPRTGCLVPWVVQYSKHKQAVHQGVGESPQHAEVHSSKLDSFPLVKQGYPQPTPSRELYRQASLWASDSSSSFNHTAI